MVDIKVTDSDIQKHFRTAIRDGVLYVYDRKSNMLILQARIILAADPMQTIEYARAVCKEIIKYKRIVYKDLCG